MKKLIGLFILVLFFTNYINSAWAHEQEQLKISDIQKIMDEIFKQHVDKKEMSALILKNALKSYVNLFDPQRIYLLETEIRPYFAPTDQEIEILLDQYKHKNLSVYKDLNEIIKKSIMRARQKRQGLQDRLREIFQTYKANKNKANEWKTDISTPFSKDLKELTKRIENNFLDFLAEESGNIGEKIVLADEIRALNLYEKKMRENENEYLGLDDGENSLSEEQQENIFALHVLKSLASSLDAHTKVFNNNEAYDMKMRLEKEYNGIGVTLDKQQNDIIVSGLVPGSQVEKTGAVKIKDLVVAINGVTVKNVTFNKVLEMVRDPNIPFVTLDLKRKIENQPDNSFQVKLKRETIAINEGRVEASYKKYGDCIIGKIALHMFYQGDNDVSSENDMRKAIKKLNEKGKLCGLVLDFRDNTGGFLMQAVRVAGLFMKSGIVVVSKYSTGEERVYRDIDNKIAYDGPLLILTSRETASAAEIVAQALQDYGVAIIVGDKQTYGKGTIQNQTVTDSGQNSFFKVTVGTYYTVSGKTPQLGGVKADILVPSFFNNEPIGEKFLDETLQTSRIEPMYQDPLADIATDLKPWYLKNYEPYIQHKRSVWRKMLPTLKQKSAYRIAQNKNYQILLNEGEYTVSNGLGVPVKGSWLFPEGNSKTDSDDDLQMEEAVNILEDMISLEKNPQ